MDVWYNESWIDLFHYARRAPLTKSPKRNLEKETSSMLAVGWFGVQFFAYFVYDANFEIAYSVEKFNAYTKNLRREPPSVMFKNCRMYSENIVISSKCPLVLMR